MSDLTALEENVLVRARDDGMIPFPRGAARAVEQTSKILENPARRGYVRYVRKKNRYRAWWLTRKGPRLTRAIREFHHRDLPGAVRETSR